MYLILVRYFWDQLYRNGLFFFFLFYTKCKIKRISFEEKKEEFLSKVPGSFIELKSIDRCREEKKKKKKKIRKNKSERNEMIHGRVHFSHLSSFD